MGLPPFGWWVRRRCDILDDVYPSNPIVEKQCITFLHFNYKLLFLYLSPMLLPADHDAYISAFMPDVQAMLQQMRETIHAAAPEAEETISYGMPAFHQKVTLVYYAGYKSHIGFYPTPAPIARFAEDLRGFKTSKGAIQFPLDKPLPVKLIKRIVKWRLKDALKKL
jgi:uncharacterized protein YdhG (YjbR/CyaY superfamily)